MAEVLLTVTARVVGSSDSVGTYNIIAVSTHNDNISPMVTEAVLL